MMIRNSRRHRVRLVCFPNLLILLLCTVFECLPQSALAVEPFPYALQWKRLVDDPLRGALVGCDSVVFIGGADGRLLAVRRRDGVRVWQRRGNGPIGRAPVVVDEELIFADAWGGVRALERSSGEERWAVQRLGRGEAEIVVRDSLVYVGSADGWLYALRRSDGTQLWRVRTGGRVVVRPLVEGGVLYIPARGGRLLMVEGQSGALLQSVEVGARVVAGPLVVGKRLVVAGGDGYVRAYGREKLDLLWKRRLGAKVVGDFLLAKEKLVCAADNDRVYGLRLEDGRVEWKQFLDGKPLGGVVRGPRGEVAVGTEKGRALALEADGGVIVWDEQLLAEAGVRLQAEGGWLYASAGDDYLYAFAPPARLKVEGEVRWEEWWEVFSFGRKTGYLQRVAQTVSFEGSQALRLAEASVEWRSGFRRTFAEVWVDPVYRPLAFRQRTVEGDQVVEVEGCWEGDSLRLEQRLADYVVREEVRVEEEVLLPEVLLLKLAGEGRVASGQRDSVRVFDYAGLEPRWLHLAFGEVEETQAGKARAVRMRYGESFAEEVEVLTWIDAQGREVQVRVPLFATGRVRVSEAQARAWAPPGEERQIHLDHPIEESGTIEELVLDLPSSLGDPRRLLVEDERQQVRIDSSGQAQLVVRRVAYGGEGALRLPIRDPEVMPYLEPSLYIQSEDGRIQKLARELRGDEQDSWKVVERLRRWVYDQMIPRDTNVRFKSALEVLEDMEGTCSEHAVLFMALCRAAGLPVRACVGFLASRTGELVLHIWAQVYVGRWVDVDPSWSESAVSALHIKTGQGRLTGADMQRLNLPLRLFLVRIDSLGLREYRTAKGRFLGAAEKLFAEAGEAERSFRDERAQELYHQLLLLPWNRRSGEAHVHIARYSLQRGKLDEAAWACERVLRMDVEGEAADDALFHLSRVAEGRGEIEAAMVHLERLVADFPNRHLADDALARLGELYEREQGCMRALPYYERVREEYSQSGWAAVAGAAVERCRRKLE